MTPEIKNRIDQIRRGEAPDEYKQTEAGILPNDWFEYRLGDILNIFRGASPRPKSDPRYYGGSIPRLLIEDITRDGKYPIPKIDSLTEEGAKKSRLLPRGTLVMSCSGTQVGIMGFLGVDACIHDGFFGFNNFSNILPEYFYQYFLLYFENLQSFATQGGVFNNLTTTIMKELKCCLPNMNEQQKIIEILTTQDRVIELKEKLITEKQRQKKYLMQQLLTGKKRLSGFTGKWEKVKAKAVFKNVVDKKHNGTPEVLSVTQDRGIIPRSQVDKDIKYDNTSLPNYKLVCPGNFVISLRSFQGGIEYSKYEGIVSPAYTVLSNKIPIDENYYQYYFKSTNYINRLQIAVYGIRDGKQISYDDFGAIKIHYPPVEEQSAIAKIFIATDREINLLQKSLEQEKQKKKALMQLLLTGIVRVNV